MGQRYKRESINEKISESYNDAPTSTASKRNIFCCYTGSAVVDQQVSIGLLAISSVF